MKVIALELRDLTYVAVRELADARGTTVEKLIEGYCIALSWDMSRDFEAEVLRYHREGWVTSRMAAALGVTNLKVKNELRRQGLRPHRVTAAVKYHPRKANA